MKKLHAKTEVAIPNSSLKEEVIDDFDDDAVFEQRTREALERVEKSNGKGLSKEEFLKELDSW